MWIAKLEEKNSIIEALKGANIEKDILIMALIDDGVMRDQENIMLKKVNNRLIQNIKRVMEYYKKAGIKTS